MTGVQTCALPIFEQGHDADGIVWPWAVAPFQVLICVLDPQLPEAMEVARTLAVAAEQAGAEVLVDDRVERPGVKFKDADLIGIPLRLTVGGRGLKEGLVELKGRSQREVVKVPLAEAAARVTAAVHEAQANA